MINRPYRGVRHGLVAAASLLALTLGSGAGQALAAPDLDPAASIAHDTVQNMTVITPPAYSIDPWQTIRQTYSCGNGQVYFQGDLLPFRNLSSANVTATANGGGAGSSSVSVLFTNWNLSPAQYKIQYTCLGQVTPVAPQPGMRVQIRGDAAIYLIDDDGTRRHIPDPQTYNNLFRDGNGVQQYFIFSLDNVPIGPDLTSGAYLAWDGTPGDAVYLVSNGQKRWITSPAVMDKFYFDPAKVQIVPTGLLNLIPSGPALT